MIPMVAIIAIVEQRINKFIFFFSTACLALKEKEILFSLVRSESFEKKEYSKDNGFVQVIFNDGLIYLSLKGIIDFKEEKKRLEKNLTKIDLEIKKIQIKLNDNNFINNAPEDIINEQKEREKEYQLSKDKIIKTIQSFT